jgi:hypothetical protein
MSNNDLLELKKIIEEKKQAYSEANVKINILMETLEKEYNCSNVQEATEYLKDLEEQKKELQNKIEVGIMELKNELGIDSNRDK